MPTFDAIVVGSGMAGCRMAAELTAGGLRVAVVEAGPARAPEEVMPSDGRPTTRVDRRRFSREGQPVQAQNPLLTRQSRGFYVNDRACPYLARGPFLWFRGRQVGGRSILWSRVALRMSDREFRPHPAGAHWENWPFGRAELAPWYARIEQDLGVRGEPAGCDAVPDGEYVAPPPSSPLLEAVRSRLDRDPSGLRCLLARTARLERTVMPAPLARALRAGATLITDSSVVRVVMEPGSRRACGVEAARADGSRFMIHGACVVLCASTIESVRILWQSAGTGHPQGIGNHADLLGRGIQDHLAVHCAGRLPADLRAFDHPLAPEPDDPWQEHTTHLLAWGREGGPTAKPGDASAAPADCLAHLTFSRESGAWTLLVLGASTATPENRVIVRYVPGQPLPVPMIALEWTADDLDRLEALGRFARRIVRTGRLGVPGRTWARRIAHRLAPRWMLRRSRRLPGAVIHETGGARMGTTPKDSVVDPWGRCWDTDNVFVADGSVFPGSGFTNPTLTIMALAARTAAHVLGTRDRWQNAARSIADGGMT